jgi:hypothetical protein
MTRDDEIQRIIERAIQSAFIDFPDAGNGMMWPQNYKEPNECKTVATAILSALKNAGYKITADSNWGTIRAYGIFPNSRAFS